MWLTRCLTRSSPFWTVVIPVGRLDPVPIRQRALLALADVWPLAASQRPEVAGHQHHHQQDSHHRCSPAADGLVAAASQPARSGLRTPTIRSVQQCERCAVKPARAGVSASSWRYSQRLQVTAGNRVVFQRGCRVLAPRGDISVQVCRKQLVTVFRVRKFIALVCS